MIEIPELPDCKALDPHWTTYAQAIGTPIVAVIAAIIAASIQYRQWRTATMAAETAKNKLKLDLFERRFAVYHGVAQLIVLMSDADKQLDNEAVKGLMAKTAGSEFLFDKGVHDFVVHQVFVRASAWMSRQWKIAGARVNKDFELVERLMVEHEADSAWFGKQLDRLQELVRPFLHLTH